MISCGYQVLLHSFLVYFNFIGMWCKTLISTTFWPQRPIACLIDSLSLRLIICLRNEGSIHWWILNRKHLFVLHFSSCFEGKKTREEGNSDKVFPVSLFLAGSPIRNDLVWLPLLHSSNTRPFFHDGNPLKSAKWAPLVVKKGRQQCSY